MISELAKKLFAYLEFRTDWVEQQELLEALPELKWSETTSHDKCPKIWSLVQEINNSDEIEKVILIKNFTYKIATEDEAKEYVKELMNNRIVPRLQRYWRIVKKMKLDGQYNLFKEDFIKSYLENKGEENGNSNL